MKPMNILEKRPLAVLAAGLACVAALAATTAKADTLRERRFDAASWPKELRVEVEESGADVVMRPDQTRKSMVRDLVRSRRLDGMGFSQVQAMLGEGRVEEGILYYALGDQPIGKYNPVILGILFDPAGRVATARAVD
jgi:hypothetical protein